jgi:hypothetical protein
VLYLYGVARAGQRRPAAKGIGSPPREVRYVRSGPIAAAASELPDGFELDDEDARVHLDVLIAMLDDGPVLPLRMGTVAPDDEAVRREVLDAGRAALVERLDSLDGLVELHVDADDDETEAIQDLARAGELPHVAGGDLQSRLELGQEIAQLLVERRQRLAEQIVATLRPLAVQDTPRALLGGPEDPALRWAFLVRRADLRRFDRAVLGVREQHPKTAIRYLGPLPPAHFVDWEQTETPTDADGSGARSAWGW